MALKLHSSFHPRINFHVGNLSIISKMDENRSLGELGTGIKMFKERPPLEPRPVLASSGCHDPGQPPPPTRGQLCMTEPSPALTSIQPFPPSLIFVMRLLHSFFWDSFVMKRLTVTILLIVVLVSTICSHVRLEVVTFGSYWSTFAIIPCSIYSTHAARQLIWTFSQPCHALHCHIKTTPCPCIIPMAYCHGLFLSFSEIYLINEYNEF